MVTKKMAFMFVKAVLVVFVLCFAVVQLASINKKPAEEADNEKEVHHLQRDDIGEGEQIGENLPQIEESIDNPVKAQPVINDLGIDNNVDKPDIEQPNNVIVDPPHEREEGDNVALDSDAMLDVAQNAPAARDAQDEKEPQLEKPEGVPQNDNNKKAEGPDGQIADHADVHVNGAEEVKKLVDHDQHKKEPGNDGGDEDIDGDNDEEEEDSDFPAHKLVDIKRLSLDEIQPPNHMDGIKMEQDGHLNKDFRKEIILGKHEEFDHQPSLDEDEILEDIFNKVDTNKDELIDLKELETWIMEKVREHLLEANEETERIFKHLDSENKGLITWQEFHVHFLVAKGHDAKTAKKHATDYETIPLDPDEKERLIRYKFRWAEADEEPQDNKLTVEEYKSFRHPEQSASMINRMVQDILENLDENSDGIVTEKEFIALPPGDSDSQFAESDTAWQEERRTEFRNVIDLNHDGKVTREELKNYVDPQNPSHGRLEAENLIQLSDQNGDNKLSLDEVLDNAELFLGSKMVDTGRNFHDEF